MIRKVRIPLKLKISLLVIILLISSIGFYLNYALNIFKEDKSADIYSYALTNSESFSQRLSLILNGYEEQLDSFYKNSKSFDHKYFESHQDIYLLDCSINTDYVSLINENRMNLDGGSTTPNTLNINFVQNLNQSEVRIKNNERIGVPPHFSLYKKYSQTEYCSIVVSFDRIQKLVDTNDQNRIFSITEDNDLFYKFSKLSQRSSFDDYLKSLKFSQSNNGVKKIEIDHKNYMQSFVKVDHFGIYVITEISMDKAFGALDLLIQKSFYFGILIASIAIIAGIIFTRRITSNLNVLMDATLKVADGDFSVTPKVSSSDEIGALTDSFVDMKDKIVAFMEEMKEKARIENEIKLAKLVQDSFFDNGLIQNSKIDLFGFYGPASECSGDWWGYFSRDQKLTVIICDATGHGLPAALVTAQAHSYLTTIKLESEKEVLSPKQILYRLNKVINSAQTNILMTAFVLEIDLVTNKMKYSNASHVPPYLLRKVDAQFSKDNIIVLNENNGPRIGQRSSSKYDESEIDLEVSDKIVLFTDGLIEVSNGEKMYGQRAFLKNIIAYADQGVERFTKNVIEEIDQFSNGNGYQDDITFVGIEMVDRKLFAKMFVSDSSNHENIKYLLRNPTINHLIGYNGINEISEFKLMKTLQNGSKEFDQFFENSFFNFDSQINSSAEINDTIKKFLDSYQGYQSQLFKEENFTLVVNELLTNAFFHSKDHEIARNEVINLDKDQSINLKVIENEDYIVISVEGVKPIVDKISILKSINRGFEEQTPREGNFGAGLGLYFCYNIVNQIWFVDNRVFCVLEKFNRNKLYQERVTSFHFLGDDHGKQIRN